MNAKEMREMTEKSINEKAASTPDETTITDLVINRLLLPRALEGKTKATLSDLTVSTVLYDYLEDAGDNDVVIGVKLAFTRLITGLRSRGYAVSGLSSEVIDVSW